MSTYVDYCRGIAKLKKNCDPNEFIKALGEIFWDGDECDVQPDGTVDVYFWGDSTMDWENDLQDTLSKFCISWKIDGCEECCDPWRFYKAEGGDPEKATGTVMTYFNGFEDDFIQQVPDEIIEKIIVSRK